MPSILRNNKAFYSLSLILILSLVSCGSSKSSKKDETQTSTVTTPIVSEVPLVSNTSLRLSENMQANQVVGKISIKSQKKVQEVLLVGAYKEYFKIDTNGDISLIQSLTSIQESDYTLEVYARNKQGLSKMATLSIYIVKNIVSTEVPTLENTSIEVNQNVDIGTVIGKIAIKSIGSSDIQEIKLSGSESSRFAVAKDGEITTVALLDTTQPKDYSFDVIASNSQGESSAIQLTIKIINSEKILPVLSSFVGTIEANASEGTEIGQVSFTTQGKSEMIQYSLSGEGHENFAIDKKGMISLSDTAVLDKEAYHFAVSASNVEGESTQADATITIIPLNMKLLKPSQLKLSAIGETSITLEWQDNSKDEEGFHLYIDGVLSQTLPKNTTKFKIEKLQGDTSYLLELKAFHKDLESEGTQIEANTKLLKTSTLKAILIEKCGIVEETFDKNFDPETGHYDTSIHCPNRDMTNDDLLSFKVLKSLNGNLNLRHNFLTNVDGLSNLKSVSFSIYLNNNILKDLSGLKNLESVAGSFILDNNKLKTLKGLTKLKSVGSNFSFKNNTLQEVNALTSLKTVGSLILNDNKLSSLGGLSALSIVKGDLYLQGNQLSDIKSLSKLASVKRNFNISDNKLKTLEGLEKLVHVGGSMLFANNTNLIDITGIENLHGDAIKFMVIDPEQYITKAAVDSALCSTSWDLRDKAGDIHDDMNHVCEGQESYTVSDKEKFKDVLYAKCAISATTFNAYFDPKTGHYNNSIYCKKKGLVDEDLVPFKILKSLQGSLALNGNLLTNVDGLSHLGKVGGYLSLKKNKLKNLNGLEKLKELRGNLYIHLNPNLSDISGIENIQGIENRIFYIDTDHAYSKKAGANASFCNVTSNLYNTEGNIEDNNMSLICK